MSNLPDFRGVPGFSRDMFALQKWMDRFLDESAFRQRMPAEPATWSPSCELSEERDSFVARFELPGISKDQIKVDLHENQLTVRAERRVEKKDEKKHYSEFSYGSYLRTFQIPGPVSAEKVSANFENGILTVTVGKIETSQARQIQVK